MSKTKGIISIEGIKDKLVPLFRDKGLKLVLLFGSAVLGNVYKESDIDLAFLFDRPVDILSLTNRVIRLLHADNIDVVDLRRASPLLKFSVVKNGRVLYEKLPGMFNEFYSLAFRMYVDTKKLRDAQEISINHFLREKGLM
jgi:predicted nucleotidyltransferase